MDLKVILTEPIKQNRNTTCNLKLLELETWNFELETSAAVIGY
jgi:hypothetical protein